MFCEVCSRHGIQPVGLFHPWFDRFMAHKALIKASIYTFSGLLAHLKMADPRGPPGPLNPVAVSVAACLELGCIVVYLFGDIPNALYLQHYDASHYTSFTDTT